MKYDYRLGAKEIQTLKSLVGKRLESYRLNDTDGSSFEIFVMRFPDTDIEVATKEIVGLDERFDETNAVEIVGRPERDSWSRVGKSEPDNGIPEGQFLDYAVGKVITGISVATETFANGDASIDFVRGLVIDIGDESIVFDKGSLHWECIWKVRRCESSAVSFPKAEFDPVEEAGLSAETRIERILL